MTAPPATPQQISALWALAQAARGWDRARTAAACVERYHRPPADLSRAEMIEWIEWIKSRKAR